MKVLDIEWVTSDGTQMYACEFCMNEPKHPRAVICLVHGMGEHSGQWTHVAEVLHAAGYAVFSFDQRGHGRTTGKRGHVPNYNKLLEGIDLIIPEARRRYPGIPVYLYGHSLGGNITLNYLLRRQPDINGAIVTSPWLILVFKPPSLPVIMGKLLELIYPKYTNTRPIHYGRLTSDPEMMYLHADDKLAHGQITAKFFFSVQGAGLWALKHANRLKVPLLLMHGGDDQVTSLPASKQFASQAGSLVHFREWPNFKHEMHNELHREDLFAYMINWLHEQQNHHATVHDNRI